MKGKVKHIGFILNEDKDFDKRCIDILENLPKGENACSYIRKAIVFYNKHDGKAVDKRELLSQEEKIDMILAKLDGLSLPLHTAPEPIAEEPKVKKVKHTKAEKKAAKEEPEELPEEIAEEEPKEVEEPVIEEKAAKENKVNLVIPDEDEEEDDGLHLSVSADTELDEDNFDNIMGGFLDDL